MDRIIYFYVNRKQEENTPPFRIYAYRRKGYELLRVGLAGWLVKRWESGGKETEEGREAVDKSGTGKRTVRGGVQKGVLAAAFVRLFQPVRQLQEKRIAKREQETELFFWENQFAEWKRQLAEYLSGERDEAWFSCEEELQPLLCCRGSARGNENDAVCSIWNRVWPYPFFEHYFHTEWVEHMLSYAVLPHYLVLGYHRELPRLLWQRAVRMKSLKWILPARFYDEGLQEFLEDFYEEYGIAAGIQLLEEGEEFCRTALLAGTPCNILDFSEEEKIPQGSVAEGSIWLDMSSLEGKRRRLEEGNKGIRYFSLKKEWKQPVLP